MRKVERNKRSPKTAGSASCKLGIRLITFALILPTYLTISPNFDSRVHRYRAYRKENRANNVKPNLVPILSFAVQYLLLPSQI